MNLTKVILCLTVLIFSSQGILRPIDQNTIKVISIGQNSDIEYSGEPGYFDNQQILNYNDKGDFAVVHQSNEEGKGLRVGFYSFDGIIIGQYYLNPQENQPNLSDYDSIGQLGFNISQSGEDDSIIITFIVNIQQTFSSVYMGILGTDGQWRRNSPFEIMHDTQNDPSPSDEGLKNFRQIISSTGGQYHYALSLAMQNESQRQQLVYKSIDLSGSDAITVNDNEGVIMELPEKYQNTQIQINSNCINIDETVICLFRSFVIPLEENDDDDDDTVTPVQLVFVKLEQGQVVSFNEVTYESLEENIQTAVDPGSQEIQRIPGTTQFILYTVEDGNVSQFEENYVIQLRKYDINDLDTTLGKIIEFPFENLHTKEKNGQTYNGNIAIATQEQAYITIFDEENFKVFFQEFNPTTMQFSSKLVYPTGLGDYLEGIKLTSLVNAGEYKLGMLVVNQNNYNQDINLMDLQNQENCENLDTQKWVCLQCSEGYKLSYKYYCIEGQGINKIENQSNQEIYQPYKLPPLQDIKQFEEEINKEQDESTGILQITIASVLYFIILMI